MERLTTYEPCEGGIPFVTVKDEQEALQRLAAYEDMEEQGRLIVLPCKVGDTFWYIAGTIRGNDYVTSGTVSCFSVWDGHVDIVDTEGCDHYDYWFTREEAEKALEGGKDNDV